MNNGLLTQLLRYGVVGATSNIVLYGLYLMFTAWGATVIAAMSITYAIGVTQTFLLNRKWTFGYHRRARPAFLRYVLVYVLGYCVNIMLLLLLVDLWRWPHQWVQASAILGIAVMIFVLQRHWVFRTGSEL